MLFKNIVLFYGRSLSGAFIKPEEDVVFCSADMDELGSFRQRVIDDITGAKVYLLDTRSASYLDSLRQMMGDDMDASKRMSKLMSEVALPAEIIWVECDYQQLEIDRVKRGFFPDKKEAEALGAAEVMGLRGFLIDNRSSQYLKITPFRTDSDRRIIDPLIHMTCDKDDAGRVAFDRFRVVLHPHMAGFYTQPLSGGDAETLKTLVQDEFEDAGYDLALPYLLFAELSSEDEAVIREEKASLSPREQKTARKFGKTWMIEALRSHVTVRIGDVGEAHLNDLQEQFRAGKQHQGRAAAAQHWVSGHIRKYANGTVTWVKGHLRGVKVSDDIPTRVVGPKPSGEKPVKKGAKG